MLASCIIDSSQLRLSSGRCSWSNSNCNEIDGCTQIVTRPPPVSSERGQEIVKDSLRRSFMTAIDFTCASIRSSSSSSRDELP